MAVSDKPAALVRDQKQGLWGFEVWRVVTWLLGVAPYPTCLVAELPATADTGARGFVTDANATTFASIVAGGGSNKVPVYFDGSDWRIG